MITVRRRRMMWLTVLVGLWAASGASCPQLVPQYTAPLPRVLPPSPSLEQVIQAVNNNSTQIQSFTAMRATLSSPGVPTLRAVVAFERPRRFRLRAEHALTGPEIDVGSNDELFWFWVRRNEPPALYFARHQQFATSPARQTIPIDPEWLIEALGLAQFDPSLPHQGPYPAGSDRVMIRTLRETPQGVQTKVTVVDAAHGFVVQQALYDSRGQLLASAEESQPYRDPLTARIMPTVIVIHSPPAQLTMQLNLGPVEINRPGSTTPSYWTAPSLPDTPVIDLCDPRLRLPQR
jgi:hypothetical protein